jgi:3-deoxy-manno-octulosonate cytidylyltransferase (CMP-KDO synthetase)
LWKANGTACSVYEEAKTVECFERVIVATESNIIVQKCQELEIDVVLISDIHPTGNDRVSKVAKNVDADHYVILMGDESPYKSR